MPSKMSWGMQDMNKAGKEDAGPKGDPWFCGSQAGNAGSLQRERNVQV